MKLASKAFDKIFPGYEQLREEANAEMVSKEIDPGRSIDVPYYQQDISDPILLDEQPFVTKRRRRELGYTSLFSTQVDGIGYETFVTVPYDELRSEYEFAAVESSAWMTKPAKGYVESPNARIFAETLMPQIATGPPASGESTGFLSEVFQVPKTLVKTKSIPLSYTAQAEQAIIAKISEQYSHLDLPKKHLKRGKSRGANLSPGHYPYAADHGVEIIALGNMGRCAPDKIELEDVPEFLAWLTMTGLGGVAASACLLKDGQLGTLKGTTSFSPNFLAANLTGTMRALASGETGQMLDWIPKQAYGREVLYGLDSLSRAEETKQRLSGNVNLRTKIVPGGTHGALLHPLAHNGDVEYLKRFTEQYLQSRGRLEAMNHDYIHGVEDLSLLEEVA